MNKIQKIIDELKVMKEKANTDAINWKKCGSLSDAYANQKAGWAFSVCIQKLTLLLSESNTGAITEAAHLANTDVGRSAASNDTSNIGDLAADSSETRLVGQNEQIQKSCFSCRYYEFDDDIEPCSSCNSQHNKWEKQDE